MITFRQLDIFVEAVRAGSFRRCADQMGMSAVAVSEHVRTLEAEIGAPLFLRRAGLLPTLTDVGRQVYAKAIVILADIADLRHGAGQSATSRRKVTIAVHTYLMRDLSDVLSQFRERFPLVDLEVDLEPHTNETFLDLVARRELDVAYCFALHDDDVPGSRYVRDEPMGIYTGPTHPLALRPTVSLDELMREPAIHLNATEPLAILVERIFAGLGVRDRKIGLATNEFGLIVGSLRRNLGYSCLFADGGEGSGDALGLARVAIDVTLPPLQVRRITRRSFEGDTALLALCNDIEERWRQV